MPDITEELLRRRAEHNNGMLTGLQEISLHQQNLERITVLNQLCRHLRILHLQNNLICRIEKLNRLKELEQLNLAVNNLTRVENLGGCEALVRLDLTLNFIGLRGLPSLASLADNALLRELHLVGNPCTQWPGYRPYVVALLPQLTRLDGQDISPEERSAAQARAAEFEAQLHLETEREAAQPGVTLLESTDAEGRLLVDLEEIPETGRVDEAGELRRPWCPATRILEHREARRAAEAAEAARKAGQAGAGLGASEGRPLPLRDELPPLTDCTAMQQKNEGKWEFSLDESADGSAVLLDVAVGRYLDTSLIKVDVQPTCMRMLIKGRLLQLLLPAEVRPDASTAQRSQTTGHLVLTMPKECPGDRQAWDVTRARPAPGRENSSASGNQLHGDSAVPSLAGKLQPMRTATVGEMAAEEGDEDALPPL